MRGAMHYCYDSINCVYPSIYSKLVEYIYIYAVCICTLLNRVDVMEVPLDSM